jgi:AraC-like DNA-binding protein
MRLTTPFRHALPVSESLFHAPLYVTYAGWEKMAPGEPYFKRPAEAPIYWFDEQQRRTLPEFCLAFVLAGEGNVQTDESRTQVHAGQAFFYRPGERHTHQASLKTGWTLMWITFNGSEPLRWLREDLFEVRNNIPVLEKPTLFRAQLMHLLESVHRDPSQNSINLSCQTMGLLSHFLRVKPAPPMPARKDEAQSGVTNAALECIWNFSHGMLAVPDVAAKLGINRRTLERRFKADTGRSVLEEIQFCRLSRAAVMLRETDTPIKVIVRRTGFGSERNLRAAFRKGFGQTLSDYRQEHTGK